MKVGCEWVISTLSGLLDLFYLGKWGKSSKPLGGNDNTEMILGFASRYACLGDLDKWSAST